METYLNFLTVVKNGDNNEDLNKQAQNMIKNIRELIKQQKSVQKDVDRVFIVDSSDLKLPRQYSEDKTMTKWEQFAVKKGIKKRKGKMVFDEELNRYISRYGSYSKKNLVVNSAVLEGNKTASKLKKEKKARVEKNIDAMLENKRRQTK